MAELQAAYRALRASRSPELPDAVPYARYIAWLATRDKAASESFFRHYLRGVSAPTRLSLTRPDRARSSALLERSDLDVALSVAETEEVFAFAKRHGLTVNTALQGALALVLGRYAGRSDVVLGVTMSGRGASVAGVERIVGLLINTLPLRARWTESDHVVPWLQALQAEQVELRAHEATPLHEAQRWAGYDGEQALFDTVLVFENYPVDESVAADPDLPVAVTDSFDQTSYPLTLFAEAEGKLALRLSWDPELFKRADIEQLWGRLRATLLDAAAHPDKRLSELARITEADGRVVKRRQSRRQDGEDTQG